MDKEEITEEGKEKAVLDYWKDIDIDDIISLKMFQKVEQSINDFIEVLETLDETDRSPRNLYLSYTWSVSIRDFTLLLRDALLGVSKYEQFLKDGEAVDQTYLSSIHLLIKRAAQEILTDVDEIEKIGENNDWKYQTSPVAEVVEQLQELKIQCKKISRSVAKVDDIRSNINEFIRDFQLQYSVQSAAVEKLFEVIDEVKSLVANISEESTEQKINHVVDQVGEIIQKIELIQGTESMELFPYPDRETLTIPVSSDLGALQYKTINIKSEFARWFSSSIYPKLIELESKRDHAVDKALYSIRQIQTKLAAIPLSDLEISTEIQKEYDQILHQLTKDVLDTLKKEEAEINSLVSEQLGESLQASKVYSDDLLFLPETKGSQITNISRDAQKRLINYFNIYTKEASNYITKFLARYIEIDQTGHGNYINNKLNINDEDESLSLFLKNGYLGKSFTVSRPEIIEPILENYRLWCNGFTGSVLISGLTGTGKSTILGKLNHEGINEEIIHLKTGESYFIEHRSYDPIYNLKELIDNIIKKTIGKRVVVCIDDLESWHNETNDLFDNLMSLFSSITKHRKKIFFVVTCSTFLKRRIELLKDLTPIFSTSIKMGAMNSNNIRNILYLRVRVNTIEDVEESELDIRMKNVVRESKGNPGMAMLEYCRLVNDGYQNNVKSQEFKHLILRYKSLLTFISGYHHCSIKYLSDALSDLDLKETIQAIDHLVGLKVLVRPKKGYIAINPFLIHSVERVLDKS